MKGWWHWPTATLSLHLWGRMNKLHAFPLQSKTLNNSMEQQQQHCAHSAKTQAPVLLQLPSNNTLKWVFIKAQVISCLLAAAAQEADINWGKNKKKKSGRSITVVGWGLCEPCLISAGIGLQIVESQWKPNTLVFIWVSKGPYALSHHWHC